MSILIKGMELPEDKEIFLRIDEKGEVYVYGSYPTELHKAVPVQPHGRLIDAGALEALFWDGQCYFTENIKYKIKSIETIIPAEEGET